MDIGPLVLVKSCPGLKRLQLYQPVSADLCEALGELSHLQTFDFAGVYDKEWFVNLANRRKERMARGESFVKLYLGLVWGAAEFGNNEFYDLLYSAKIGKLVSMNFE